jgi:hypothetical protein
MLCECDVHDGEFSSVVLMENEGGGGDAGAQEEDYRGHSMGGPSG